MSKGQEERLCIGVFVRVLPLLAEYVRDFKKLFLDAIKWYDAKQVHDDKTIERIISDKEYSLLVELRERVENGNDIPDKPLTELLEVILGEYQVFLRDLRSKVWVRRKTVDEQLEEIAELSKELLTIKQ